MRLMETAAYELWYRLKGRDACLIALSADQDGLVFDESGVILSFSSSTDLRAYAEKANIQLVKFETEPSALDPVNLDTLEVWLRQSNSRAVECQTLLSAWNLFWDASTSLHLRFDSRHLEPNSLYDKLFWGCNLPSMTPDGEVFHPTWSSTELETIRSILGEGLAMFRSHIKTD